MRPVKQITEQLENRIRSAVHACAEELTQDHALLIHDIRIDVLDSSTFAEPSTTIGAVTITVR